MTTYYGGFLGLIIAILDIWAIVNVVSSHRSVLNQVIWVVIILLLPILGFILWAILGPRRARY
jgi:Phospholipase_D-nuclease N-terminal